MFKLIMRCKCAGAVLSGSALFVRTCLSKFLKKKKKKKKNFDGIYVYHHLSGASVVQWLRALTLKHWISHRCGSSLTRDTCEMPSSAPVGHVVFLRVLRFRPPLINDRLDISETFLKGL